MPALKAMGSNARNLLKLLGKRFARYFLAGFIATAGITQLLVNWNGVGRNIWVDLPFMIFGVFICSAAIGAALLFLSNGKDQV